jgi:hypothetical protein
LVVIIFERVCIFKNRKNYKKKGKKINLMMLLLKYLFNFAFLTLNNRCIIINFFILFLSNQLQFVVNKIEYRLLGIKDNNVQLEQCKWCNLENE